MYPDLHILDVHHHIHQPHHEDQTDLHIRFFKIFVQIPQNLNLPLHIHGWPGGSRFSFHLHEDEDQTDLHESS